MSYVLILNYRFARRLWERYRSPRTRAYAFWAQDRLAHWNFETAKQETFRK